MRGHLRERGEKSWAIVLELPRGPDGKRKQQWISFRGSHREAERELKRLVNDVERGTHVAASRLTVAEFLNRWLIDWVASNLAPKTQETYTSYCRRHLIPRLGGIVLGQLGPMDIQRYYADTMLSGLCQQTVAAHHAMLRVALGHAVRWGLIQRNPTDLVDAPRVPDREIVTLDEGGVKMLLDAVADTDLALPVLLAVATGARRSEVLGIQWRDLDLDRGLLSIKRTVVKPAGQPLQFAPTKTRAGRRPIKLPQVVIDALRVHRERQSAVMARQGSHYQDSGLVVAKDSGQPHLPTTFTRRFGKLRQRLGLPGCFHTLRSTHATVLMERGIPVKVVSERLGHSRAGVTSTDTAVSGPGCRIQRPWR